MEKEQNVDIVVTWVDGSDEKWQNEFNKFNYVESWVPLEPERYRSSDNLLGLWLKGVKKYAKWVSKIYVIVDRLNWHNQIEVGNGVEVVFHDEFIPEKYLPTFNSNVIEMNIHRIQGLSENFILFNDDCFVTDYISKEDFFDEKGRPVDTDAIFPIMTTDDYGFTLLNNLVLINQAKKMTEYKRKFLKRNWNNITDTRVLRSIIINALLPNFHGWQDEHMPIAYKKTTFNEVWDVFSRPIAQQQVRKIRTMGDVSHLLCRYWQLVNFNYKSRKFGVLGEFVKMNPSSEQYDFESALYSKNNKIICVNDREMDSAVAEKAFNKIEIILTEYYT